MRVHTLRVQGTRMQAICRVLYQTGIVALVLRRYLLGFVEQGFSRFPKGLCKHDMVSIGFYIKLYVF